MRGTRGSIRSWRRPAITSRSPSGRCSTLGSTCSSRAAPSVAGRASSSTGTRLRAPQPQGEGEACWSGSQPSCSARRWPAWTWTHWRWTARSSGSTRTARARPAKGAPGERPRALAGDGLGPPGAAHGRAYKGDHTRRLARQLSYELRAGRPAQVQPPLGVDLPHPAPPSHNEIERLFCRLERFRRIATRYDKRDVLHLGRIYLP